ncbi:MlaA family lipoprotein [Sandaracinobacteroides hominis]|uniref:MlaA family lipoprotein n=1 Tax=Sandaracinobacteroides hominis TaxID=2780086 RepID=UPI0018F78D89|nr:VacJ family lipoprotein [Sandaracinobacteroides hominis]
MSRVALPLLAALLLSACAHGGEKLDRVAITDTARADPWEKTNRKIYGVSMALDRAVLRPVTDVYRFAMPEAPRRGISNAYDLFQEPTYLANAVAQGKIKSAFRALDRIMINTVLGLGVADHATGMGLDVQKHDFGQTLAVWNVPSGPYVMLPFLGPSTARDSVGFFVDFILDPMDYVEGRVLAPDEQIVKLGIRLVDTRASLRDNGEQLLVGAADPYATVRSAWLQNRRYEIFDGNLPDETDDSEDLPPLPPLPDEQAADPAPAETPAETPEPAAEPTPPAQPQS